MPTLPTLLAFFVTCLALVVVPGPSVLFVVARSIEQGTRAGLASVVGGTAGIMIHVIAAAVGLAASARAFTVVKLAGAAYLVYLGLRTLLSPDPATAIAVGPRRSLRTIAAQATLVYVLNPKIALMFLAILPQFVDPARGDAGRQLLIL